MRAVKLNLENFRNLKQQALNFTNEVNIIYGDNAQGKTNILEAIWIVSAGKSFRNVGDKELINHDEDFAKISLNFADEQREQRIDISYFRGRRKELKINDVKQRRIGDLIGKFTTVMFAPEHLNLVKEGPSERRRFIDFSLSELSPRYFGYIQEYNKIIERRNSLLKKIYDAPSLYDTLDVWDIKAAKAAAGVTRMRHDYVKRLYPLACDYLLELSGGKEKLSLEYKAFADSTDNLVENEIRELYLNKLRQSRGEDIKNGLTGIGPHRDDLHIEINGYSAKKFGSQGQQRSCVLALKIAEAQILYEEYDEHPVFLLDDVLSELDSKRQEYILSKLYGKQVIVTSCEPCNIDNNKIKIFHVKNGCVSSE